MSEYVIDATDALLVDRPTSELSRVDRTTDKAPTIHDKAANEIRFTCECGHVTHIAHPDPFELLSLYQDSMLATCGACRRASKLELREVVGA